MEFSSSFFFQFKQSKMSIGNIRFWCQLLKIKKQGLPSRLTKVQQSQGQKSIFEEAEMPIPPTDKCIKIQCSHRVFHLEIGAQLSLFIKWRKIACSFLLLLPLKLFLSWPTCTHRSLGLVKRHSRKCWKSQTEIVDAVCQLATFQLDLDQLVKVHPELGLSCSRVHEEDKGDGEWEVQENRVQTEEAS